MSSKVIDLIELLLAEITNENHKTKLKQLIEIGDMEGLVKCLKRHSKLEHQKIRNKRCYNKKKEQPINEQKQMSMEDVNINLL